MRQFHFATMMAAVAAAAMGAPVVAQSADAAPPAEVSVPLPGWLAGCWVSTGDDGSRTEECWTAPRGSMLLGSSHTFSGQETRWFEHMRIERDTAGLVFVAQPRGVPPTRFASAPPPAGPDGQPLGLLFVSAEHDYPQRVHYYRDADGNLVGEIAMLDGSRMQRWVYRRLGGG